MKEIKDMNLLELTDEIELNIYGYPLSCLSPHMRRLRELHELTRWIPVSERMPTEEDSLCLWVDIEYFIYYISWARGGKPNHKCTHWKRITPPEDK